MKYVIKKLSTDFIADELEQVRKQFVDALTYTMESSSVVFNQKGQGPLDVYIEYDFQQKGGESVIYGFNLQDEIAKKFALDVNKYHSSKQLLTIGKQLKLLADEIESRYQVEPSQTLEETEEKKAEKFAKKVNRSYKQVLKDALAKDEALKKERQQQHSKEFIDAEYKLNKSVSAKLKGH